MTCKVVFDTSSLVSAAIRPDSIPDQALTLALATCQVCTSSTHLSEVENVLRRKRFDSYVSLDSRLALLQVIRLSAELCSVPQSTVNAVRGCCRDPNDEFVLALALAAKADLIVSSDHDLLVLHPWRGISVLTPTEFVAQFST
jgi:uncharacterized protein